MNVLQIVPELNAGGVERTTLEIAEALSQAGHTPHVASKGGRLENALKACGTVLHTFDVGSKNPLHLRRNTKTLIDIIRSNKIDIVHARSRAPAWPAQAAAKATGTHFVTTYHGIYNAKGRMKRRYNAIMAKGDIIIANSHFTKAHIIKEHGTDPNIITVIPRGVDLKHFDPDIVQKSEIKALRDAWDIAPDQILILLPGRLTRWKGQTTAIDALQYLPDHCVLVCLGDAQGRTDYVDSLWNQAKDLGVETRLRLPGHSSNMPVALSCADMILSASTDPEAFGRIAIEAQAMQRPIIATALGGSLETIIDGQTGHLINPENPKALASAIDKTLQWDDYDGRGARQHIVDHFSKAQLQTATIEVYKQLLV